MGDLHPREARGEGKYVLIPGTRGYGLDCPFCFGPCSMDHDASRYEFVPTRRKGKARHAR